jgi:hypothetical protein
MWEAIDLAIQHLLEQRKLCPKAPMRIITLADGIASKDALRVRDIRMMVHEKIRFDGIFIGGDATPHLVSGARMTGGYLFCPHTVDDIDPIFQDEAFFNLDLRDYHEFCRGDPNKFLFRASTTPDSEVRTKPVSPEWLARPLGDVNWLHEKREANPAETYRDMHLVDDLNRILAAND